MGKKEKLILDEIELLKLQLADSSITNITLALNEKNARLDELNSRKEAILLKIEKEKMSLMQDIRNLREKFEGNLRSKKEFLSEIAKKLNIEQIKSYNYETGEINIKE